MTTFREKEEGIWKSKAIESIRQYWNWNVGLGRSNWFADEISACDLKSIYEVGVFSGRNVSVIKQRFPNIVVGGLDINEQAIAWCKSKIDGQFDTLSAFDVDQVPGDWDALFTMGVFIHLAPDLAEDFVKKMIAKANKYIFHVEVYGYGKIINGPAELKPSRKITNKIRWEPNIVELYKKFGQEVQVVSLPTSLKAEDCNTGFIIKLSK